MGKILQPEEFPQSGIGSLERKASAHMSLLSGKEVWNLNCDARCSFPACFVLSVQFQAVTELACSCSILAEAFEKPTLAAEKVLHPVELLPDQGDWHGDHFRRVAIGGVQCQHGLFNATFRQFID